MAELNPVLMQEIMGVMNANNVIQNILGIPMIEIEQLNPRIRIVNGVMKVKYHSIGGDIKDPDGTLQYEYDWVGGVLEFIANPYPRAPLGTGRVAFLADDERDPLGKGVTLPQSSKSGFATGWNREFLASHYGEGYWRIVNSQIDEEIRDRYRQILISTGIKPDEVEIMVKKAVERQLLGMAGQQKVTISRSSGPVVRETLMKQDPTAGQIENHPLVEAIRNENAELKEMIKKLTDKYRPAQKEEKGRICKMTGKSGKCKAFAIAGSDFCYHHSKAESASAEDNGKVGETGEPAGNLGQ